MARRYILNKYGQKHSYDDLAALFNGLDPNDRLSIIQSLGLDNLVGEDGGLAPVYSVDITSSEERFLNPLVEPNITLVGKVYNYFQEIDTVTSWKWTRESGNASDSSWVKTGKTITLNAEDLTDKVKTGKVYFILTVEVGGETITDRIDFSNLVSLNTVQITQSSTLFLGSNPSEITLTANYVGVVPDRFSWYVNDSLKASTRSYKLKNSDLANGDIANVRLEVIDVVGKLYTDSISVPKLSNGSKGEPGVVGPAGADGQPSYTWIKYADDSLGSNMSEYPTREDGTFREYMGVAANKTSPIESSNPSDYTWSRYIGEDGIPGANGYMWIVYSQFPKGINTAGAVEVHNDPYDEDAEEWLVYLGIAYNKEVQQEPNFNTMTQAQFEQQEFFWSKIKGEDGHTGYVFDLSNEMHSIPTDSEGLTHSSVAYDGADTEVYLYYGNDLVPIADYVVETEASTGIVFSNANVGTTGRKFTVTNVNSMADSGTIVFKAYDRQTPRNLLSTATFSLVKAKNAPAYKIKPNVASVRVQPGVGTAADTITPTTISIEVLKNTGSSVEQTTEGTLTYKYNYQTGDGTPIDIGSTLTVSNAGNPSYIQFLYFDPINNMLSDIETIPFVRDGRQGDPGEPGVPGQDGANGEPGPRGPFLAPRGNWSATANYVGNNNRIEAVLYQTKWYVTLNTAGNVPVGTLPTNTTYWKVSDETFDFIATGLLLAQTAYIENLGVRSLRTNDEGERIEILKDTNSMKFYLNNRVQPAVHIGANSLGGDYSNGSQEAAVCEVSGKVRQGETTDRTSQMTNSGMFSNGSNTRFLSTTVGAETSASIVGIYQIDSTIDDPYNGTVKIDSNRSAVAGIHQYHSNEGRTFGGYFNALYSGATYKNFEEVTSASLSIPHKASIHCSTYVCTASTGVLQVQLPLMALSNSLTESRWVNTGTLFEMEVILAYDDADVKVISSNGAVILNRSGQLVSEFTQTARGTLRLIWIGKTWIITN